MTNWNNISFSQKGWECPRCGRINAPWLPCCSCDKSTVSITWTQDTTLTNAKKDGEGSEGIQGLEYAENILDSILREQEEGEE